MMERLRVIDVTIEVVAGRVPILAGATSNSTHDAVEKAREVATRPGVNAILTASPYYNKPTQEGQYRHFRAIAEAVNKPIILYNVPGRTGANIEPATLARLAEVPEYCRSQGGQRQHSADGRTLRRCARDFSGFFLVMMRLHWLLLDWVAWASFRLLPMRSPAKWLR